MIRRIGCPHCRGVILDHGDLPGQQVKCPHCGGHLTMPPPAPPPVSIPESAYPDFSAEPRKTEKRARGKMSLKAKLGISLVLALVVIAFIPDKDKKSPPNAGSVVADAPSEGAVDPIPEARSDVQREETYWHGTNKRVRRWTTFYVGDDGERVLHGTTGQIYHNGQTEYTSTYSHGKLTSQDRFSEEGDILRTDRLIEGNRYKSHIREYYPYRHLGMNGLKSDHYGTTVRTPSKDGETLDFTPTSLMSYHENGRVWVMASYGNDGKATSYLQLDERGNILARIGL